MNVARLWTLLAGLIGATAPACADTIAVPSDYETIQEAIDVAVDGDVIEVSSGVYVENVDFLGKTIALIGCDGPDDTIISGEDATRGSDAASVITLSGGEGEGTLIEGLTIESGPGSLFTTYANVDVLIGGGILVSEASATIQNCHIEENTAGGLYARESDVLIVDCIFDENTDRGGVEFYRDSTGTIRDCTFSNNIAEISGGGVKAHEGCTVVVEDCVMTGNDSLYGGGVSGVGSLEVRRTVFEDNTAFAGTLFVGADGSLVVEDCVVYDNYSFVGGALAVSATPGLECSFTRCLIAGNEGGWGGAVYLEGEGTTVHFDRCTVSDNTSTLTSPLQVYPNGATASVDIEIVSSILWGNGVDALDEGTSEIRITYSVVEDGWDGDGNIDEDPLFVDTARADYSLDEDSPCIDTGDPDVVDPDGTVADMGAYYYRQAPVFIRGDIDTNGMTSALVDSLFLLLWSFSDGPEPLCMDAADVDDSGSVGALTDSLALLQWGFTNGDAPPEPGPETCGFDTDGDDDGVLCEEEPDCS